MLNSAVGKSKSINGWTLLSRQEDASKTRPNDQWCILMHWKAMIELGRRSIFLHFQQKHYRQTDRLTDWWTDTCCYRDVRTHLKIDYLFSMKLSRISRLMDQQVDGHFYRNKRAPLVSLANMILMWFEMSVLFCLWRVKITVLYTDWPSQFYL